MSAFHGYGPDRGGPPFATITVEEAYARAADGTLTLIDVRRPEEWDRTGRPQGSHGATLQDPDFVNRVAAIVGGDRSRPLAMTCASGARSARAAEILAESGFVDVANVSGGIIDWSRNGLPIDTAPFEHE